MDEKYNRRQILWYGATALTSSLLLKACANNTFTSVRPSRQEANASVGKQSSYSNSKGFKIAIVLPGSIADNSWNQIGYEGVNRVREMLGVETAYVEKVGEADRVEALSDFARRRYNLIFAHGAEFDAAIQQVAAQFQRTFFVGVNGAIEGMNTASLKLDYLQASYVCGIIGALMTKSNQMAYLGAESFQETHEELRGFELGAKSVKPDIKITSSYTGDWNDVGKAKEATLELISAGSDVIYQWLNHAAPTVLETASEKGVYAFGNTTDQFHIAPKAVVTSVVKRLDRAIAYLADLAVQSQIKGEIYTLGFAQKDIFHLGQFGEMVPQLIQDKATETVEAIISQKIYFENCKIDGQDTRCVKQA